MFLCERTLKITRLLFCISITACSSQSQQSETKLKQTVPIESQTNKIHAVQFTNSSTVTRPGFVRMPLLARIEFNIFISYPPLFHQVNLDQGSDFFYSGDTHIPFVLSVGDTVSINTIEPTGNIAYNISAVNKINEPRIIIFQEAIKNGVPLFYTELDNQQQKLVIRKQLLNNPTAIIKVYRSALLFAESYCKKMEKGFSDYFMEYLKFDHYIKIFTYCLDRKIVDSLFKINYFDFNTDGNNQYILCNYAYFGALYQAFLYRFNKNVLTETPLKIMAFIDTSFGKKESDLIKLFYLKGFGIKLIAKSPLIFDSAVRGISDTSFKQYMFNVAKDYRYQMDIKDQLVNISGKTFSIGNIIKAPSKTLKYIDFWASWCGPCRSEFPYYLNLVGSFSKDEIEFITISIDQDVSSWKRALVQENLEDRFANYFYPNPSKDNITSFKLESIPRYCIVDRQGNVIVKDAPRPSDSTLIPLLHKLVNERKGI